MSHDGIQGQSETDSEEGFEMKVLGAWIARCTLPLNFVGSLGSRTLNIG